MSSFCIYVTAPTVCFCTCCYVMFETHGLAWVCVIDCRDGVVAPVVKGAWKRGVVSGVTGYDELEGAGAETVSSMLRVAGRD